MSTLIETSSETQVARGWSFAMRMIDSTGAARSFTMTLSWADYNLWSRSGSDRPAAVAEAAVMFLVSREGSDSIRPRFDASLVRRLHADADVEIPRAIRSEL